MQFLIRLTRDSKTHRRNNFNNKRLFQPIISFRHVQLNGHKPFLAFGLLLHPMETLHCNQSIIGNEAVLNKGTLFIINNLWKNRFDSVRYILGNHFHDHVTRAYRPKILGTCWMFTLGNQNNMGSIYQTWAFVVI
ncbi:unnamed protein product [Vicia faba]|uniref:Uncharacterized protein n=1 Tax=Vicia faba TaxID=3906 RepID=A0AAV1ASH0_VICFA|nr:unnamed protein product [Vicia faba]